MAALGPQWENGWQLRTRSRQGTQKLALALAKAFVKGTVVGLVGDLGAGKTSFVQGLAQGLGVTDLREVLSPTYTLVNEYPGAIPLVHMDFYRLQHAEGARALGIEEQLARLDAVVVAEWADMLPELMPAHTVWVRLETRTLTHRDCTVVGAPKPAGLR